MYPTTGLFYVLLLLVSCFSSVLLLPHPDNILEEEIQENNIILDDDIFPGDEIEVRNKRIAPAIPFALWGIRLAPAMYNALLATFGAAAVTQAGIEINRRSRSSKCCRGHLREFHHVHNCLQRGGGCCADDATYVNGMGKVGLVNPRKITRRDTSGNCYQCFSSYGKC